MATKIAINGFGRIGRLVLMAMAEQGLLGKEIDLVAVVDVGTDAKYFAYQLKYDSIHGRFPGEVATAKSDASLGEDDILIVNGQRIKCVAATKSPIFSPGGSWGSSTSSSQPDCTPTPRRLNCIWRRAPGR